MTYHGKIIKGGKAAIPAALRRKFGLADGDSIVFADDGDQITVKSSRQVLAEVRARVKAALKHPITVDDYIAEKRAEAARE